ncbi:Violaxanthin [Seminavis robusta]|uniref:Violaxanthin n=1 Tax=Seminavis robusta TaxID=568900 RepID=A0A9N8DST9_9STRA|nr:Violaxanthin [Seminavis robusta]|eukprot:Sro317_g115760.1 Violaxanthin (594) ;mRNA; r:38370-40584
MTRLGGGKWRKSWAVALLYLVGWCGRVQAFALPPLGKVSIQADSSSTTTTTTSTTTSTLRRNHHVGTVFMATTTSTSSDDDVIGSVAILLPSEGAADSVLSRFGDKSPVGCPPVWDAAEQLARKTTHFSLDKITTELILAPNINNNSDDIALQKRLQEEFDVVIAMGLRSDQDLQFAQRVFDNRRRNRMERRNHQAHFGIDCTGSAKTSRLTPMVGPHHQEDLSPLKWLPWTTVASAQRMQEQMQGLFARWTTDDYAVAIMLFFNQFGAHEQPIDWVKHSIDATWEKGPIQNAQELAAMASKCGDCVVQCVQDEKCKECLDRLTEIDTRDQVASYRTIVSYESELLRDFSFCILQKNNIFNCDADIPSLPKVAPITTWRGKPLTKQDGQAILIGHLDDEDAPTGGQRLDVSWVVACGANVAYDQFPSQNQIFYKGISGKDMWYDPVFRVECIDGRNVWCKRHYKVRDGPTPGTFYFSVLDNGITSNEFWTIAGVADDLSWIVFHYAGAASAVGQQYLGGLVCTPDGKLPPESAQPEIWAALDCAGIAPWDLYVVNNDLTTTGAIEAGPPPLDFFRRDVLAAKEKKKAETVQQQ